MGWRFPTCAQAVRPGTAPLGLHKGEACFPRTELSVLHTAERWKREGKEVLEEELGKWVLEIGFGIQDWGSELGQLPAQYWRGGQLAPDSGVWVKGGSS